MSLRRGFTLFQLLVILALLGVLLGLLLPAVQKVRQSADRIKCSNNLKQIILGTINCADTYQGQLPPAAGGFPKDKGAMTGQGTVFFHILPFIEQDNLYKASLGEDKEYSVWNNGTFSRHIVIYECPTDASGGAEHVYQHWLALTSYAANFQVFGAPPGGAAPTPDSIFTLTGPDPLHGRARYPASITDGTSNTIFFTERYQLCNDTPTGWGYTAATSWAPVFAFQSPGKFQVQPLPKDCDATRAQSSHAGGINVGMGDGSVRFVAGSLTPVTWWHAITPNGGEVLGADW